MRPTGRSFSSNAALAVSIACAQVDHAEARRTDDADAGAREISRSRASRASPSAPASAKPSASTVATLHAEPAAFLDRLDRASVGVDDIGVVGHLRQLGERRPGALAQHLVAPRIDRIDAPGIAGLPQIFQRPRRRSSSRRSDCPTIATDCGASRTCASGLVTRRPRTSSRFAGAAGRSGGRTRARRCGSSASRSSRRRSSSRGCAACSIPRATSRL